MVRRESLRATLSPVVHSIPEDDWVFAEAEALLYATPGLREDLRAAMDELHAGTLQTVDAATAPSANRSPYQVPRLILSGCPSTGVA